MACTAGASAASPSDDAGLNPTHGKVQVTFGFGGGNTSGPIGVAACLTAAPGAKNDFEVETFVVQSVAGNISHTLGTSTGNSEDGTVRGVPIITSCARKALAFAKNSRGQFRRSEERSVGDEW